ncbi:MAG: DeoR/GlpR transcriptional regulator [Propionibacteriaceae bacterium]|uniref:DeoR-type HTH domain n=1 Tax=Propionibacterium ruminifibrarum TaxID=1962131 RepID=A0A375I0F7_9ACTN|nr:DeoR/GlpR family DNA-binding transcription regulator [Propionibacterium ruminifibrarum]MBE6476922.1 DeoR/GlpR transcriptional regulator [Propionibacteriaceae bacterium]SPF68095.1 DeoR-type HTH domain [Propionibacterium ruminifibrarum]
MAGTREGHSSGPRARQYAIAQAVIAKGKATVEELADLTGVSAMTIYRDIAVLEQSNIVQLHNGTVVAVASGLHEADAVFRLEQASDEKRLIAAEAATLVANGSSVMLDDSSSSVWLLRALADLSSLTIVTNSLLVAGEVTENRLAQLIMTGGEYRAWAHALMGPTTVQNITAMHADYCFLSTSGISSMACFHPYQEVAEVKAAMLRSSEVRVLLIDNSKFNRRALFKFAELSDFDHVIVDDKAPEADLRHLEDAGVAVTVAASRGRRGRQTAVTAHRG